MQHRREGTDTLHHEKVAVIRRAPLPAFIQINCVPSGVPSCHLLPHSELCGFRGDSIIERKHVGWKHVGRNHYQADKLTQNVHPSRQLVPHPFVGWQHLLESHDERVPQPLSHRMSSILNLIDGLEPPLVMLARISTPRRHRGPGNKIKNEGIE